MPEVSDAHRAAFDAVWDDDPDDDDWPRWRDALIAAVLRADQGTGEVMREVYAKVYALIEERAATPELARRAREYVDQQECSCEDDPFGECWFRANDDEQAFQALRAALADRERG